MTCWRCTAKIPDGTEICPICGTVQKQKISFRTSFFRWMLWACPLVSIIANTINLYFLITGAHYLLDLSEGILPGRYVMYTYYPALYWMDMVLLAFIWIVYGLIIATAICAQRKKSSAPILLLITNVMIFLWTLSALFCSILITDLISPVLVLTVIGLILQMMWTTLSFLYLKKSNEFIY